MNNALVNLLVRWFVLALGVVLSTKIVPGISYDTGTTLAVVVLVLSFFNAVLKPLLLLFTLPFIVLSLGIGMFGYAYFEHLPLLDAFLNSAMLLGGMGPVKTEGLSDGGKVFAGFYALYAGLVFIAVTSIMLAPVVHRVLHQFHWSDRGDS